MNETYEPIVVAVALSRYAFNVDYETRALRLYEHFDGDCADLQDLERVLARDSGIIVTELAFPTAEVYVRHALEQYGAEAKEFVRVSRTPIEEIIAKIQRPPEET